jgi:hypothetical protein
VAADAAEDSSSKLKDPKKLQVPSSKKRPAVTGVI